MRTGQVRPRADGHLPVDVAFGLAEAEQVERVHGADRPRPSALEDLFDAVIACCQQRVFSHGTPTSPAGPVQPVADSLMTWSRAQFIDSGSRWARTEMSTPGAWSAPRRNDALPGGTASSTRTPALRS